MNLCSTKWADQSDPKTPLIDKVKIAQVSQTLEQTVTETTRTQLVIDQIRKSSIDHVYTNCGHKLKEPEIIPVQYSDHMGVVVTKITKHAPARLSSIRLRQYKNMDILALQSEILNQDLNNTITEINDLDEAADVFCREVSYYLSKYAPVKISQVKKNTKPYTSEETKDLIKLKK